MCLAVPGRIIAIDDSDFFRKGRVSFSGVEREIDLLLVPEALVGDYVLVHVGFAIVRLDLQAAERSLRLLEEIERDSLIPRETSL